ncbi:MAG: farnesyl diphosphate synthase [Anaerovoracaceae bacterium]|nr:polyprenyl synthetase family protein [Bacillota bacterium]MDY2670073.1 farnesyl diphosphate synthase [Anaerovoracaceae bacterium]
MRPEYKEIKDLVEENLLRYLPETDRECGILYDSMKYSLEAGGKRIRPVLLIASCRAAGGTDAEAIPYACAIEFIHTYSLIHDDHPSMDNDDLRRGKPTNHKVFGDDMAILAGDGLLNSAMDVMFDDIAAHTGETARKRLRAAREISRAAGTRGMIAGQTADVRPELIGLAGPEKLRYIHRHKTGALIRAAAAAGAYVGGADGRIQHSLEHYAEQIGIAFQIIDDVLDVIGDAGKLGKNTGVDEELGKLTYPSFYGVEKSEELAKEATDSACAALEGVEGSGFLKVLALDLLDRIF